MQILAGEFRKFGQHFIHHHAPREILEHVLDVIGMPRMHGWPLRLPGSIVISDRLVRLRLDQFPR